MDKVSINFCNVNGLSNSYNHTYWFADKAAQLSFFTARVTHQFNEYNIVKRRDVLHIETRMDVAKNWNYLYFLDPKAQKHYFYFINQVDYRNDNMVDLSIELDVLQTYMFDWQLRPCYIDREHAEQDVIGLNTVDEGLDVGEYMTTKVQDLNLSDNLSILMACTVEFIQWMNEYTTAELNSPGSGKDVKPLQAFGKPINNVLNCLSVTATPISNWVLLTNVLRNFNTAGHSESIVGMWEYPTKLIATNENQTGNIKDVMGVRSIDVATYDRPETVHGYTPKNKKLLQYPYIFMYAHNNQGASAVYRYEWFLGKPTFKIRGVIAPDAIAKLVPQFYRNINDNFEEALSMPSFPVCAWNNDVYKLWLAQNQNTHDFNKTMSIIKIGAGVATTVAGGIATATGAGAVLGVTGIGGGVSMITSGISEIQGQLATDADKQLTPPQAAGTFSANFNISHGVQDFQLQYKTIDANHARIIDDYFTMYGYACRQVKTPNISSRPAFNYVKTIGSNIWGNFAQEDINKINSIFDKGVTFWKQSTDIGNYAVNNQPT